MPSSITSSRAGLVGASAPLDLVIFAAAGQRCALLASTVRRAVAMVAVSPLPKAPPVALGVINLQGEVIPVLDIRRRLGLPPCEYGPGAHLLVARTLRRMVALAVDEVLGVTEVAAQAVASPAAVLPGTQYVSGIVALEDGILFIHDLDAFLSLDEEQALAHSFEESGA